MAGAMVVHGLEQGLLCSTVEPQAVAPFPADPCCGESRAAQKLHAFFAEWMQVIQVNKVGNVPVFTSMKECIENEVSYRVKRNAKQGNGKNTRPVKLHLLVPEAALGIQPLNFVINKKLLWPWGLQNGVAIEYSQLPSNVQNTLQSIVKSHLTQELRSLDQDDLCFRVRQWLYPLYEREAVQPDSKQLQVRDEKHDFLLDEFLLGDELWIDNQMLAIACWWQLCLLVFSGSLDHITKNQLTQNYETMKALAVTALTKGTTQVKEQKKKSKHEHKRILETQRLAVLNSMFTCRNRMLAAVMKHARAKPVAALLGEGGGSNSKRPRLT